MNELKTCNDPIQEKFGTFLEKLKLEFFYEAKVE